MGLSLSRPEELKKYLEKWSKIDEKTGCKLWNGKLLNSGHGRIWIDEDEKDWLVHRLVWTLEKGEIINQINHKRECFNKNCILIEHLYDGTQEENNNDIFAVKGHNWLRGNRIHPNSLKTHCPKNHEYTPENTYLESGYRRCKICRKMKNDARPRKTSTKRCRQLSL